MCVPVRMLSLPQWNLIIRKFEIKVAEVDLCYARIIHLTPGVEFVLVISKLLWEFQVLSEERH